MQHVEPFVLLCRISLPKDFKAQWAGRPHRQVSGFRFLINDTGRYHTRDQ
jgi:hypothetical protein